MRTLLVSIAALAWSCSALPAQNLVGSWQGTLAPPGGPPLRTVVKITRSDDEKLKAAFYSIDQGGQALNASTVTLQGSTFKMVLPAIGGEYEGKLSEDANTITGNWTQGGPALPLVLVRATAQTAWGIPEPPPPPKLMPADAKPVLDVSTVKLSAPDARGSSILVGRGGSNLFTTTNTSVKDLIIFAYGLHAKQLVGGPAWMESEHFDITGKPDLPGMPSAPQLMAMVQKLIQERFQLSFHREKKELSVYAITVAKGGPKLTKTEVVGASLPGFGGRGPGSVMVRNAKMEEFAGFLQSRVVDRPVVDQTSLPERYDFTLKWTPDINQPAAPGQPAPAPAATDVDAPPDLFGAFQQQLGLKLEATKAPVDVLVVDKIEKPSEN